MEAGKMVQRADWENWRRDAREPFKDVADLQTGLRPKIDRASEQLLSAYAALRERLKEPAFRTFVQARAEEVLKKAGIDSAVRAAALEGWLDAAATGGDAQRSR